MQILSITKNSMSKKQEIENSLSQVPSNNDGPPTNPATVLLLPTAPKTASKKNEGVNKIDQVLSSNDGPLTRPQKHRLDKSSDRQDLHPGRLLCYYWKKVIQRDLSSRIPSTAPLTTLSRNIMSA